MLAPVRRRLPRLLVLLALERDPAVLVGLTVVVGPLPLLAAVAELGVLVRLLPRLRVPGTVQLPLGVVLLAAFTAVRELCGARRLRLVLAAARPEIGFLVLLVVEAVRVLEVLGQPRLLVEILLQLDDLAREESDLFGLLGLDRLELVCHGPLLAQLLLQVGELKAELVDVLWRLHVRRRLLETEQVAQDLPGLDRRQSSEEVLDERDDAVGIVHQQLAKLGDGQVRVWLRLES